MAHTPLFCVSKKSRDLSLVLGSTLQTSDLLRKVLNTLWRLRSSLPWERPHSLDSSLAAGILLGNFRIWRELTRCSERSFPPQVVQLLSLELSSASAYIQVLAEDPTQPPE